MTGRIERNVGDRILSPIVLRRDPSRLESGQNWSRPSNHVLNRNLYEGRERGYGLNDQPLDLSARPA